ncbi:MAG: hypothetical protein JWO78_180 [Micavibrio sp.]|nr:hypothetical protein [Micavibrio sp.]
MPLKTILGLVDRETALPSFLDIKAINDNLGNWRSQLRDLLSEHRKIKAALEAERDLYRRYALRQDLKLSSARLGAFWTLYRETQHDSRVLSEQYLNEINR